MSGTIKGITISFNGDTTKLDSALRDINKNTRNLDKELKSVDKALKFNPTSVELWRQKQDLLKAKISETKDKLDVLKQAQAKMDADGVDKTSADYQKLKREIIETESKVKTFEGQLRKVGQVNLRAASEQFKQWGGSLENAGRQMAGLSKAAAAVAASIGALTVKSGQWADDINTMSKKYSISTTDLQKYSAAADLVDVSTEDLASSQQKLKRSMFSAREGGEVAEVFETLGVAVTDSNGELRNSEAVFNDVLKALGSMENETERDALAMQILGKSAANLNPLIEDGGETYKRVADTLAKYNLDFISEEDLQNANKFNDEIDTIKTIGLVAFQSIGTELAGYLAPALEKVVEWVGKFAEWLSNLDPELLAIIAAVAGVVSVIAPLLIGLGKLSTGIGAVVKLFSLAGPALAAIGPAILPIVGIIAAVVVAFKVWQKHGDKIKKFFSDFGKKIVEVWENIKVSISTAIENIKKSITDKFNAIKTTVTNIVNGVKSAITTAFNAIKSFIQTVLSIYVTIVRTQWTIIQTVVTTVVNGIKTVVTTVFNTIKTFITNVSNGIKIVMTTAWNGIKAVTQTVWNGIKYAIETPINGAKIVLNAAVNAIKNLFSFSGISSKVSSAMNAVKNAITGPIEKAKNIVKGIIDTIKGFFNFSVSRPRIPLPHFSISPSGWKIGDLLKGSIPRLSVSWYKKGGIFDAPSVIGVGEAGAEAVVPLDKFWSKLDKLQGGDDITINVYASQGMDVTALANEIERRLIESQKRRRMAWQ